MRLIRLRHVRCPRPRSRDVADDRSASGYVRSVTDGVAHRFVEPEINGPYDRPQQHQSSTASVRQLARDVRPSPHRALTGPVSSCLPSRAQDAWAQARPRRVRIGARIRGAFIQLREFLLVYEHVFDILWWWISIRTSMS